MAFNNLPQIKVSANPPSATILNFQKSNRVTTSAAPATQLSQQEDEDLEEEEESVAADDSDNESDDDIPCAGQPEVPEDWTTLTEIDNEEGDSTLTQPQEKTTTKLIRWRSNKQTPPLTAEDQSSARSTVQVQHKSPLQN